MLRKSALCFSAAAIVFLACAPRKYNDSKTQAARPATENCGNPGEKGAPNPAHCPGPIWIDGQWGYDEAALNANEWWIPAGPRGYLASLFGATIIFGPMGGSLKMPGSNAPYVIRDMHYHLGNGKVGIRPIPVIEDPKGTGTTSSGETIKGYEKLDEVIRATYGLAPDAPVWGIGVSNLDGNPLIGLDGVTDRVRGRAGHIGLYVGKGYSRHQNGGGQTNKFWKVKQQPETIVTMKMKGVDPAVLNANLVAMSRLMAELNGGFNENMPRDQINDPVGQVHLSQMLNLFAAWIKGDNLEALKQDPVFSLFCAEFANVVINLGVNLPLQKEYFVKIWGASGGEALWNRLQQRVAEIDNYPTFYDEEIKLTDQMPKQGFVPLWERDGVNPRDIDRDTVGRSFAWPLESAGDAIAGAIETFGNWPAFGPELSIALMLAVGPTAQARTGIEMDQYISYAAPVAGKILKHFAPLMGVKTEQAWNAYVAGVEGKLKMFPVPAPFADNLAKLNLAAAAQPHMNAALALNYSSPAEAWNSFEQDVAPEVKAYRSYKPLYSPFQQAAIRRLGEEFFNSRIAAAESAGNTEKAAKLREMRAHMNDRFYLQWNANPILFMRVAQGMRNTHPDIEVRAVGTIFDASLLKSKSAGAKEKYEPTEFIFLR